MWCKRRCIHSSRAHLLAHCVCAMLCEPSNARSYREDNVSDPQFVDGREVCLPIEITACTDQPRAPLGRCAADRDDDVLEHPFVNALGGLELFDLQHFETIWVGGTCAHGEGMAVVLGT